MGYASTGIFIAQCDRVRRYYLTMGCDGYAVLKGLELVSTVPTEYLVMCFLYQGMGNYGPCEKRRVFLNDIDSISVYWVFVHLMLSFRYRPCHQHVTGVF